MKPVIVTSGGLRTPQLIVDPAFRAHVTDGGPFDRVRVVFSYGGRTRQVVTLGSGDVREALAIGLPYRDPCNATWISWRLRESRVVVQRKHNPGQTLSLECGNSGYKTIEPDDQDMAAAYVDRDRWQVFEAAISAKRLIVRCNEEVAWSGPVLDAPDGIGLRTDNCVVLIDAEWS